MKWIGNRKPALAALGVLLAWMGLGFGPLVAQTAISGEGVIESTSGGFKFPDGTVQTTAATSGSAPLADTGQQACYDPSGATTDEINYVGTGQDGEKQVGVEWPTPRFTDNGDGTVTDNLTGLVWLKQATCLPSGTWANALSDSNGLADPACGLTDGSLPTDWRLPNIKELSSLVDYGQSNPALPSGSPFTGVLSTFYWTSTSVASNPTVAWSVTLSSGPATVGKALTSRA